MIRISAALVIAALLAASCGDSDPEEATSTSTSPQTIAAPLLPSFREPASARLGSLDTWITSWNLANATFISQNERFPEFLMDETEFEDRAEVLGFPMRAMQRNQVIMGVLSDPETDDVTALVLIGQPRDIDFLTAFPLWVATLDPTLDPGRLLPDDLVLGDRTTVFAESNDRTYRVVKTGEGDGIVVALTMVGGPLLDEEVTLATHDLIRTGVLGGVISGEGAGS